MKKQEIEYIKKLLDLFYEGQTTLDEERLLFEYFGKEDVPAFLKSEQQIFLNLYEKEKCFVPLDLEANLSLLITHLEEYEAENIKLKPKKRLLTDSWKLMSSIAASIVIVLCIALSFNKIKHNTEEVAMQDTFSNTEDAYKETQKVMLLVSAKLNKGSDQLENLQKNINKANKIISKNNIEL